MLFPGSLLTLLTLLMAAGVAGAADDLRLVEAARNRDQQAVRALLNQRAEVNGRSPDGTTALLWAAHWNDLETADLLMRAGANANAMNDFRITPLSLACTNGNAALVERLLQAGATPHTAIATGETPMMTCAGTGSADAVRMLMARGADVNAKEPLQHQTALMWAAAEHHVDVVRTLIEHRADLRARTKKGFTALHFAAREGDLDVARLLLAAGVDVNIRSQPDPSAKGGGPSYDATISAGSTPLLVATMRAHVPLALFLLEHGADPNVDAAGFTALHWAAGTWESGEANPVFGFTDAMSGIPDRQAKLQLVKALLAHGANPNARIHFGPHSSAIRLSGTTQTNGRGCGKPSGWVKSFRWDRKAASPRAIIFLSMASMSSRCGSTEPIPAFAAYLEKLRSTPDGDGSLLDHMVILYGAGLSNSDRHTHGPLPTLVAGGGAGTIKGGRHLVYAEDTPLTNLHVTLLDKAGVPVERLGDSTGTFRELSEI